MKKLIIIASLFIMNVSCKEEKVFKYQYDQLEQKILCGTDDDLILNEALYAFEKALLDYYDPDARRLAAVYAKYMYNGMAGTVKYQNFLNPHLVEITRELENRGIINRNSEAKSDLNYSSQAVSCVIDNIEESDNKITIKGLITVNQMDPAMLSSRLMNFTDRSSTAKYEALYIALDSFYQRITPDVIAKMPTQSE